MKDILINSFNYATVDFSVHKMVTAKTVWLNVDIPGSTIPFLGAVSEQELYAIFKEYFAYGIFGNDKFDEIKFDLHDEKVLKAERYGGVGIVDNAGGVRCGNLGEFQIKGIGKNCLVGSGQDGWHSYGCLSMLEAICEVINSVVLNYILPVGTAKCYGLICTGENTSCPPSVRGKPETGPGALLVREVCLRPAHFYRSNFYRDKKHQNCRIVGDVFRTRQVNIQLQCRFENNSELISALGDFLLNCANQFAFARVFRIMHGAITPSNISFDGRWLDLTTATFVNSGENYAASPTNPSFYSEAEDILIIVEEFLYNYGKYTCQDFNIAPLLSYYWEQFNTYLRIYTAEVLGFSERESKAVAFDAYFEETYQSFLTEIMQSDGVKVGVPSAFSFGDPVLVFVESRFRELSAGKGEMSINSSFTNLVKNTLSPNISFYSGVVRLAICSLRKIYFKPIFFRGNVVNDVSTQLNAKGVDKIVNIVAEYELASKWLFAGLDTENEFVLLNCKKMRIVFNVVNSVFYISGDGLGDRLPFKNSVHLKSYLTSIKGRDLRINGFYIKESIIRLLEVINGFEGLKDISVEKVLYAE